MHLHIPTGQVLTLEFFRQLALAEFFAFVIAGGVQGRCKEALVVRVIVAVVVVSVAQSFKVACFAQEEGAKPKESEDHQFLEQRTAIEALS